MLVLAVTDVSHISVRNISKKDLPTAVMAAVEAASTFKLSKA
jgi:hypothetical protein